ncbi:hypothetical protein ScPMuIL_014229 [Solemya velum]
MVKTESGEEIDPEKLRTHGTVVMQGLGAAVESLDDSVFLSNILIAVGDRHAKYNVNPEMITLLWPSIRDVLKERLNDDFTEESEMAWKHVFDYIAGKIAEGILQRKENNLAS